MKYGLFIKYERACKKASPNEIVAQFNEEIQVSELNQLAS